MTANTITLLPRVSMSDPHERLAAVRDIQEDDLRVALGEEFYAGMGAQRLLGHQVIQVFQEWRHRWTCRPSINSWPTRPTWASVCRCA